jgi:hypothetical protein
MVASKDLLLYLVFTVWFIIEDRNGFGGDFPEINPYLETGVRLFDCVYEALTAYCVEIFKLAVATDCLILRLGAGNIFLTTELTDEFKHKSGDF